MNAKLTQDELQAIKERAEKATPGPWKWTDKHLIPEVGREAVVWGNFNGEARAEDHDAEFIAASRQDIPKLLAEIERLQAEVHEHSAHNGQLIATHVIPTKEENKRLKAEVEQLRNHNHALTVKIDTIRGHIDDKDEEITNLKDVLERVQSDLTPIRGFSVRHDTDIVGICANIRRILNGDEYE